MPILDLVNITKSFRQGSSNLRVLKEINLSIKAGQILSIVGPSGSGKSTLLHILGLLDIPTSGQVYFDGNPCSCLSENKRTEIRRNKIGFVYQFHHLLPEFSALENLVLPLLINGINKKQAVIKAQDILIKLGLKNKFHNMPSELSGGEKQRVAIGRSLVNNPQLLLADEPTGNLDTVNAEIVLEMLLEEVKTRNLTAIIVTHNLEIAEKTDNILTLKEGEIYSYSNLSN